MRYFDRSTFDAWPRRRPIAAAAAVLLFAALALAGCEDRPPPPPQTGPEPTDSLVKLLRHRLTAEDPVAVTEEIFCEMKRLRERMGRDSAMTRIRQAEDTVYGPDDSDLRRRVDSALANKVIGIAEDCDLPTDSAAAAGLTPDSAADRADSLTADSTVTDSINPRR